MVVREGPRRLLLALASALARRAVDADGLELGMGTTPLARLVPKGVEHVARIAAALAVDQEPRVAVGDGQGRVFVAPPPPMRRHGATDYKAGGRARTAASLRNVRRPHACPPIVEMILKGLGVVTRRRLAGCRIAYSSPTSSAIAA